MEMARDIFGVIIDPATGVVDEKATATREKNTNPKEREARCGRSDR
jgi:hypothetical protein